MAKKKSAIPAVEPAEKPAKKTKCEAADIGHHTCACGGQHCGDNVTS